MKKLLLLLLFISLGIFNFANAEEKPVLEKLSPLEKEYNEKLEELNKNKEAEKVSEVDKENLAKQQELAKKQEELRYIFSPKMDASGVPAIPFIMPQGNVIQIPFVDHVPYFFTYAEIFNDGKIMVNETVDMVFSSEKGEYSRQFVRELKTSYEDRTGKTRKLDIQVESVYYNKDKVPFFVSTYGDKLQIRVFAPEGLFKTGASTFYIKYVVDNSVFFTPDFDDIYYNVIGYGFKVPIARAGISVIFPKTPNIIAEGGTIGSEENSGIEIKKSKDAEGNLAFAVSNPLIPKDVFSLFLTIDKGVVIPPSVKDKFNEIIRNNAFGFTAFFGLLIISLRYLLSFFELLKKKTSKKIKSFASYTASSFLYYNLKRKIDDKTFALSLIAMASKGAIKIIKNGEDIKITKISDKNLAIEEKTLLAKLFKGKAEEVSLKDKVVVKKAFSKFKCKLIKRDVFEKIKADIGNILVAFILISLLSLFIGVQTYNYIASSLIIMLLIACVIILVVTIKSALNCNTLNVFSGKGGKKKLVFYVFLILLFLSEAISLVYIVWGLTTFMTSLMLVLVGFVIAYYPYVLKEKRLDNKVFDVIQYKEFLKSSLSKFDEETKVINFYKKHMASAFAVDFLKDFDEEFLKSSKSEIDKSCYEGFEESSEFVFNVHKTLATKIEETLK